MPSTLALGAAPAGQYCRTMSSNSLVLKCVLTRYSMTPRSRAGWIVCSSSWPLTTMTGRSRPNGFSRSRNRKVRPSIGGMETSRMIRSGRLVATPLPPWPRPRCRRRTLGAPPSRKPGEGLADLGIVVDDENGGHRARLSPPGRGREGQNLPGGRADAGRRPELRRRRVWPAARTTFSAVNQALLRYRHGCVRPALLWASGHRNLQSICSSLRVDPSDKLGVKHRPPASERGRRGSNGFDDARRLLGQGGSPTSYTPSSTTDLAARGWCRRAARTAARSTGSSPRPASLQPRASLHESHWLLLPV